MRRTLPILIVSLMLLLVYGCGDDGMDIGVGFNDDSEVPPDVLQGQVLLENMEEHGSIRIELKEMDLSLLTASDGSYALPNVIADGKWTLRASYPFFTVSEQTFVMFGGVPESELSEMELTQEIMFDVQPERPFYTYGETVVINLDVYNLVDYPVTISSATSPMTAFAVRRNGETVVGGLLPGQGVKSQSVTIDAGQVESFTMSWIIDNPDLEPGEYEIFAVLTASDTYPDYFSQDSELVEQLNESLFAKLTPAIITIQ